MNKHRSTLWLAAWHTEVFSDAVHAGFEQKTTDKNDRLSSSSLRRSSQSGRQTEA